MTVLNLTMHRATPDQVAAGVIDMAGPDLAALQELLTFDLLPIRQEVEDRARRIAALVPAHFPVAMIGGAPWLMPFLAAALSARDVRPFYAFSVRETEEQTQPDGTVRKVAVFRHAGFVPAWPV
jgi:hypothetical protein